MLLILLYVSQMTTLVSCQCMTLDERREQVEESNPDSSVVVHEKRLIDCIDECLSDGLHSCKMIVFSHVRETCTIVNGLRVNKCEGCVVMTKWSCKQNIVDFQCFKTITYRNRNMSYLQGLETEDECRRICILINDCSAYTWLQRVKKCGLQVYRFVFRHKLEDGEISAKKQRNCDSNRCTVIKFNAMASKVSFPLPVSSMSQCNQKLLQSKTVKTVLWQYEDKVCLFHPSRVKSVYMPFKKQILIFKQRKCKWKPDVCTLKVLKTMIPGGFKLSDIAEQDCVTLCTNAVNCAAVSWSRDRTCRFHHVMQKMVMNSPNWTSYKIDRCAGEKPKSHIDDTYYSWMGSKSSPHKFSSNCFKCALQCQIINCPGFRCLEGQGRSDQCSFGGTVSEAYIPD